MDELPWMLAVSALGTGAIFGYVIQRGGFCLTRALSNAVLMRDGTILRAYLLALLVAMVGVQAIEALGLVDVKVLDHFIVAPGACLSFAERGLL